MISRMFGAPLGAVTPVGKADLDSLALRPMTPSNGPSGTGRTGEPPVGDFWAGLSWANTLTGSPLAASQPSRVPTASTVTAVKVLRVRMCRLLVPCSSAANGGGESLASHHDRDPIPATW